MKFTNLQDVESYAKILCIKYDIPQTRIEWSTLATRRYGRANCRQMCITLSKKPIEHNLDNVYAITDLILHEIAHLLVGPGHRHDEVWKAKAKEIGAVPMATIKPYERQRLLPTPKKYIYICPNCGKKIYTNRKRTLMACGDCCKKYNNGKYDSRFILQLKNL